MAKQKAVLLDVKKNELRVVEDEGDLVGCTDEDYELIQKNLALVEDRIENDLHIILTNVDYY